MKLTDLQPRWLTPNVFIFRCPHCVTRGGDGKYDQYWLSVKNVPMSTHDQIVLFEANKLQDYRGAFVVVPCKEDCCWTISGPPSPYPPGLPDFATMSVTPSLNASASGHWHGFITNGDAT
jgi:hypothetical protein